MTCNDKAPYYSYFKLCEQQWEFQDDDRMVSALLEMIYKRLKHKEDLDNLFGSILNEVNFNIDFLVYIAMEIDYKSKTNKDYFDFLKTWFKHVLSFASEFTKRSSEGFKKSLTRKYRRVFNEYLHKWRRWNRK